MSRATALVGLGLLLTLGACDKLTAPETAGTSGTSEAAKPAPSAAVAGKDSCGAAAHQTLVGTGAGKLDAAALPKGTRVIFPGMPVTMDYREDRMNVEVGKDDKVARVYCG